MTMGRNMTGDGAKVCSSEGIKPVVHIYRLTPLPPTSFPILLASQVERPLRPRASYVPKGNGSVSRAMH